MNKQELYSMWEMSIPANNASTPGISGLNSDEPIIRLDGRKKNMRNFVKRILSNREKRLNRRNRKNQQNESLLYESGGKVIDQLKKIAKSGQSSPIIFDDGSKLQTSPQDAAKVVELYRNLNNSNKVKMIRTINDSSKNYEKIKAFAQAKV